MTKHVSFAPFSFKASKEDNNISVKITFRDLVDHKSEIYEDDKFLVDKESIINAINYLNLKQEDISLLIPLNLGLSSKEISSEHDKDMIFTKRFTPEQMIYPFFSKDTFPSNFKLYIHFLINFDYQAFGTRF